MACEHLATGERPGRCRQPGRLPPAPLAAASLIARGFARPRRPGTRPERLWAEFEFRQCVWPRSAGNAPTSAQRSPRGHKPNVRSAKTPSGSRATLPSAVRPCSPKSNVRSAGGPCQALAGCHRRLLAPRPRSRTRNANRTPCSPETIVGLAYARRGHARAGTPCGRRANAPCSLSPRQAFGRLEAHRPPAGKPIGDQDAFRQFASAKRPKSPKRSQC